MSVPGAKSTELDGAERFAGARVLLETFLAGVVEEVFFITFFFETTGEETFFVGFTTRLTVFLTGVEVDAATEEEVFVSVFLRDALLAAMFRATFLETFLIAGILQHPIRLHVSVFQKLYRPFTGDQLITDVFKMGN
jgi:hypothetical protein